MTANSVPATGHVPWRRSALFFGVVASTAWLGLLLLTVARGTEGAQSYAGAVLALAGLVFSFVTTFLLRRMWSGDAYLGAPRTGRLLAAAFEIFIALAIILSILQGGVVQVLLAWTAVVCFLAAFVLALPAPPPVVPLDDED
jgi:NADH:ubiquinone oxidoreductase subunit 2 (subunit N)